MMQVNFRRSSILTLLILSLLLCVSTSCATETDEPVDTFKLFQLPTITDEQCLSYIIQTESGKVVVFDGGRYEDHVYLLEILDRYGIDHVDAWFITHVHFDHFGALVEILERDIDLEIGTIYGSTPTRDWVQAMLETDGTGVDAGNVHHYNRFLSSLEHSGRDIDQLSVRDMRIGGLIFEILRVWNPEIHKDAINNSSIVLRVTDSVNSILFTGDLTYEASLEIIRETVTPGIVDRLPSDFVQIAHHGLNGVGPSFYTHVDPDYALWPAPMIWYGPEPHPDTRWVKRELEMLGIGENERFVSGRDGLTIFQFTIPQTLPGVIFMERTYN